MSPFFAYRGIQGGREVQGFTESADETNVRSLLEGAGVNVSEVVRGDPPPSRFPRFAFRGHNSSGSLLQGVIEARTPEEAKERLQSEYQVSLTEIREEVGSSPVTPPPPTSPARALRHSPLRETVRLYAGWLIAWYGVTVTFGYYAKERALPFDLPLLESLASSDTVAVILLALYSTMLLTSPQLLPAMRSWDSNHLP